MRSLNELIQQPDETMNLIRSWIKESHNINQATILSPVAKQAQNELYKLQVTTHSTLGAVAYCTGGILLQQGWLRILGSGHGSLPRAITTWNEECGSSGFLLVADDVVGGFFALNGGSLGKAIGQVHYLAPDTLAWESLNMGYTDFLHWALTGDMDGYYETLRWTKWQQDVCKINGNQGFMIFPPLWTKERDIEGEKGIVPISELWGIQNEMKKQVAQIRNGTRVTFDTPNNPK